MFATVFSNGSFIRNMEWKEIVLHEASNVEKSRIKQGIEEQVY